MGRRPLALLLLLNPLHGLLNCSQGAHRGLQSCPGRWRGGMREQGDEPELVEQVLGAAFDAVNGWGQDLFGICQSISIGKAFNQERSQNTQTTHPFKSWASCWCLSCSCPSRSWSRASAAATSSWDRVGLSAKRDCSTAARSASRSACTRSSRAWF